MATINEMKKRRKTGATGRAQKVKTKKRDSVIMGADQVSKTTEEVTPISKYKEWKLLYVPYPFKTTGNNISPVSNPRVSSKAEEEELSKYKGLCKNCKKKETCILPKPEAGIWHCEEYE